MGIRRAVATAALGVVAIIAVACGGDSTGPSTSSTAGTYALVTVNGQALPTTISNTALGTVVIQNASIVLSAPVSNSAAYTAQVNGLVNGQGPQRILADNGTYTQTGSTITFVSTAAAGLTYAGNLNGNSLTVTIPGIAIGASGSLSLATQKSQ